MRNAPLPQLDRGTDYESVRRGFESLTAHHRNCRPPRLLPRWLFCFHGLISSRGCYLGAKRRPSNPSFSEHCSRFRTLTGKNRVVCILFLLNAFRLPLSWQNSFEMYAFRLNDGKILAPCMHFRMQSGNSEYIAQESCRQRLYFTSGASKSCMLYDSCYGGLVPEVRARYVSLRSPLSIG